MDFSFERIKGRKTRYMESKTSSSLQVIFLPGIYNPEIWKHQTRYFSENFRTVSFDTETRDYSSQEETLGEILDRQDFRNVVLISHGLGNTLCQAMEHREEVIATVLTGAREKARTYPRRPYNFSLRAVKHEPKLFKKAFFSNLCDYRIVKKFLEDTELPSYSTYRSFAENYSLRRPVKNSMIVHAEYDRLSSLSRAKDVKQDACISIIRDAGTFSFYEKPQEYNKALLDFLKNLEAFVETREISQTRQQNRSLKDFVEITG